MAEVLADLRDASQTVDDLVLNDELMLELFMAYRKVDTAVEHLGINPRRDLLRLGGCVVRWLQVLAIQQLHAVADGEDESTDAGSPGQEAELAAPAGTAESLNPEAAG